MIIAKYKFDKSVYENLLPVFNNEFVGYTVSDITEGNVITRTIECDIAPTYMRFGKKWIDDAHDITEAPRAKSLLEVLDMTTYALTDMNEMFRGCANVTSIICDWRTSNVRYLANTFEGCNRLDTLDVSEWDVSNVLNMFGTFKDCYLLTSIDVSKWNTSKVDDMHKCFSQCRNLTSLDVGNWDVSNVINMTNMFSDCHNIKTLDVGNWDVSNVTSLNGLFINCTQLISVDVSRWNVSKCQRVDNLFNFCNALKSVDVSNWDITNATAINGIFGRCETMTELNISNLKVPNLKIDELYSYYHMFIWMRNLKVLNLGGFKINETITDLSSLARDDANPLEVSIPKLEKVICYDESMLKRLHTMLPNRSTTTAGIVVTHIKLSDELVTNFTAKNWIIKDLVVQYRFDAVTYENLIPEFNAEFTSDKYEIKDNVSESIIENVKWVPGSINNQGEEGGIPSEFPNAVRTGYISILNNVTYISNFDLNYSFYDENKNHISTTHTVEGEKIVSPTNAKYVRFYRGTLEDSIYVKSKTITRTIESKNGELPTQIKLGLTSLETQDNNDVTDRELSLLNVYALNSSNITDMMYMFRFCKRVMSINTSDWDTSKVTSMHDTFLYCHLLTEIDVSKWDTSNVTKMTGMFNTCRNVKELDVSNFNTSKVVGMHYMFQGCEQIERLNLLGFDTSSVNNMKNMFAGCWKLRTINASSFNTSKVTDMASMFKDCRALYALDIANFNNTALTTMDNMVSSCNNLAYIKCNNTSIVNGMVSQLVTKTAEKPGYIIRKNYTVDIDNEGLNAKNWIVAKYLVADYTFDKTVNNNAIPIFDSTFNGTYGIVDVQDPESVNYIRRFIVSNYLPTTMRFGSDNNSETRARSLIYIHNLDCSNLYTGNLMFTYCRNIKAVYCRFNIGNSFSSTRFMFGSCPNLYEIDVTGLVKNTVTTIDHMFDGSGGLTRIIGLNTWDTSNVTDMRALFEDCIKLTKLDVSSFNTSKVTDMKGMFAGYDGNTMSLVEIKGLENFDTRQVKDMSYMFYNCVNLTEINVSSFDTSNVELIEAMFRNCSVVKTLDVGHFSLSKVTSILSIFENCKKIVSLDTSKWDLSNVTRASYVFKDCYSLRNIDVSNWDLGKVTEIQHMFSSCQVLSDIDVSRWNTSNINTMQCLFHNCFKLTTIDVSNWDTRNVTSMHGLFDDMGGKSTEAVETLDLSNWNFDNVTLISNFLNATDRQLNIKRLYLGDLEITQGNKKDILDNEYSNNVENPRIYTDVIVTIETLSELLPDRSSIGTPGFIFTTVKDKLSESTIQTLSNKNWVIDEIITQYEYDALTYEDYLPVFNAEFTTDDYVVYDDVHEINIDVNNWEWGAIRQDNGAEANENSGLEEYPNSHRTEFLPIIGNVTYKINMNYAHVYWYNGNKEFISYAGICGTNTSSNVEYCTAPLNAKYIRLHRGMGPAEGSINAKTVTRTIESTTGKLPTYMRFGNADWNVREAREKSLLKVFVINSKELNATTCMFNNCHHLSEINAKGLITNKVTGMGLMFHECQALKSIEVEDWDTSNVIYMNGVFQGCWRLKDVNVSDWNTGKVTTFQAMFSPVALTSLNLSKWDVSNATKLDGMFDSCELLLSLDISNWDTNKCTNMNKMFNNCGKLSSILGIENLDVSNVTNLQYMFAGCTSLTSLDLSAWNTSKVTLMDNLFYKCENLTSVNVSTWNTSKVTYMTSMFHNCKKLITLDVSNWDTGNVGRMDNLFNSCNNLQSLDVSRWNTSNVTNLGSTFGWCWKLTELDVSNWDTSKVVYLTYTFTECVALTSLDLSNWDVSKVISMQAMFSKCYYLTTIGDTTNWDTSNITNLIETFNQCNSLTYINVGKWNTSKITSTRGAFNNCTSLTSLYVNNWDTSKVTDMYAMFSDCYSLNECDISNLDMSRTTYAGYMFDGKEKGTSINIYCLNLSGINWASMISIEGMFYKNVAKTIILPKNINSNLQEVLSKRDDGLYGLFYCPNLVSLDLGGLDLSNLIEYDKNRLDAVLQYVPKLKCIKTDNVNLINDLAQYFPTRTEAERGKLITKAQVSDEIKAVLSSKYWDVVTISEAGTLVTTYKFDKSIYKSHLPVFNNEFTNFIINDNIEDESNPNVVTRSIYSMDGSLPTYARFGIVWKSAEYDSLTYPRSKSVLSIEYLNTDELTSADQMFRHNRYLTYINTEGWTLNKLTNMDSMFECCGLTSIDVSNWDTRNVTNMVDAFNSCGSLTSIDVSNWDTRNVIDTHYMFYSCINLVDIDVSNWDTGKVTNMCGMFEYCGSLTSIDVSKWNTINVYNMCNMFADCCKLTSIDVSNWNTGKVTNMSNMFKNCEKITEIKGLENFNTINVTNMYAMFQGCKLLSLLDVSNFNTINVTNMSFMFYDCRMISYLDTTRWCTSKVTSMNDMFFYCNNLTFLDVGGWDTSNVKNMAAMFQDCYKLTSLDVSNWNTSKVTSMHCMFLSCSGLKSLDLSNFTTDNVNSLREFIRYSGALETLDISNFNIKNDININDMLSRTPKLSDIGMIYCDQKTIEKVASSVDSSNVIIWIGKHIDINSLGEYPNVTFKYYEVEDDITADLVNPLLEGDRLEIIDGNLYHYRTKGIEVLDGDCEIGKDWYLATVQPTDSSFMNFYHNIPGMKLSSKIIADILPFEGHADTNKGIDCLLTSSSAPNIHIIINTSKLISNDIVGIKNYIRHNPITVVYELANPHYELIKPNVGLLNAEQGLYLNISDSKVPVLVQQDLCRMKLNYLLPNVEYKVKFKADKAGSVSINLGGVLVPLEITEGWNEVMITTPENIENYFIKIDGPAGILIKNIMVIDSAKDFGYFKGINNTFDEIPVKNICTSRNVTSGVKAVLNKAIDKGRTITVVGKAANNDPITLNLYNDTGRATGKNLFNPEIFRGAGVDKRGQTKAGTLTVTDEGYLIMTCNNPNPGTFIDMYMDTGINSGTIGERVVSKFEKYLTPVNGGGIYTLSTIIPDYKLQTGFAAYDAYIQCYDKNKILISADTDTNMDLIDKFIGKNLKQELQGHSPDYWYTQFNLPEETAYVLLRFDVNGAEAVTTFTNILFEKGDTGYEPFRNYCNENPITVTPDDEGKFAVTIRADRDWVDRIAFDADVNDLVVLDGDMIDCYPDEYLDPSDVSYLVEFKTMGSPYGFGKKKLI